MSGRNFAFNINRMITEVWSISVINACDDSSVNWRGWSFNTQVVNVDTVACVIADCLEADVL